MRKSQINTISVLYIGANSGTSGDRFRSLTNLVERTKIIDPYAIFEPNGLKTKWNYKTGALFTSRHIADAVMERVGGSRFELAIVDNGELISPDLVKRLKSICSVVVNINQDHPYGRRDGSRFRLFLKSVPHYDVVFCPRAASVAGAILAGAKSAKHFWFSANEAYRDVKNHPSEQERAPFRSSLSFTGTWMEDRHLIVEGLLQRGIDIRVYGPRWDRAPNFAKIQHITQVGSLSTTQYAAAVAAADISLCLLSAGNRDEYTTRSLEIPTLKSMLLAPRTRTHLAMYQDRVEACFWSSIDECASIVAALRKAHHKISQISEAGYARALRNDMYNDTLMQYILAESMDR